ncbi:MAG TPA: energy transducer TonB [Bryobacteraceae bacterium]|nr:energy transducer TonB [Bryobacteraceae bacterium]
MITVLRWLLVPLFCVWNAGLPLIAGDSPQTGPGAGAPATEEPIVPMGAGVTPPRVTRQASPEHPAKGFRISGSVLISLVVSSKGEPKDPKVVRSLEKEIDQSAIDAVMKWQFAPAIKDGNPVATRVTVEIRFHDM